MALEHSGHITWEAERGQQVWESALEREGGGIQQRHRVQWVSLAEVW